MQNEPAPSVPLDDREQDEIRKRIKQIRKRYRDDLREWHDWTEHVESYKRGNHYPDMEADDGESPEDIGITDREYPVAPYTLSVEDRIIAWLLKDDAKPVVTPEDAVEFPLPDEHPLRQQLAAAGETLGDKGSHNEIVARLLTARLDRFVEKSKLDLVFDEILEIAASQRTAFAMVTHESGEMIDEPNRVIPLESRHVLFDRRAATIEESEAVCVILKDQSREEIQRRYDVTLSKGDKDAEDQAADIDDDEGLPEQMHTVDVEYWWLRDRSTTSEPMMEPAFVVTDETGQQAEVSAQEAEALAAQGIPVEQVERPALDEDGNPVTVEVERFVGGRAFVVMVGQQVLSVQQNPNASGRIPVHELQWRRIPRRVMGIGAYDMTKDANQTIDRLMQYGIRSSETSQAKVLTKKDRIKNWQEVVDNEQGGFIDVETDAPLSDAFMPIAGTAYNPSHFEVMDRVRGLFDEMSGASGVQIEKMSKDMSGDAIEGLAAESAGGFISRLARRFEVFRAAVFKDVIHNVIAYEDHATVLKLSGLSGETSYFPFNFAELRFDGFDFEASWDVTVEAPRNMPRNPIRRAQYIIATVQTILGIAQTMGHDAALLVLEVVDIPNKSRVRQLVEKMRTAQEQGGQSDPELMRMQAEGQIKSQEMEQRFRVRLAESVGDALEEVAKKVAASDPDKALQIIANMPAIVLAAYQTGQMPPEAEAVMAEAGQAQPGAEPMVAQ